MANYDFDNFKFSADILEMSAKDFKALVRKRYGWTVKKATACYKHIHGLDVQASGDLEQSDE